MKDGQRIISASNNSKNQLQNLILFNFDKNYILKNKIFLKVQT